MTYPEPDATMRRLLIDRIRAEADNVADEAHPEEHSFALQNEQYRGLWKELEAECRQLIPDFPGHNTLRRIVREVAHELYGDGVLIPGKVDQDYPRFAGVWTVSFTRRGLEWAKGACRIRTNPQEILDAVQAVANDFPKTVTPGCVVLVQEAVTCIERRCFRAATVLVGVAAEEATSQLMECVRELKTYSKAKGWKDLDDAGRAFAPRWAGARQVLAEVKQRIKPQLPSPRPEWWSLWEGMPDSLATLAEAVRVSRNTAAHDADHRFTYLEAATLLCGLPHQLRWIAEIQDHIQNPRDGVNPD